MGEIAEDMVAGACCSLCGVYFEREHGHPVLCHACYYDDANARQPSSAPVATHKEIA